MAVKRKEKNTVERPPDLPAEGRARVVIEGVSPELDGGRFAVKRLTGETIVVEADMFGDGHDLVSGDLLYRPVSDTQWQRVALHPMENDRWTASFPVPQPGFYVFTVEGWVDHFRSWQRDLRKKFEAQCDVTVDLQVGAGYVKQMLTGCSGADTAVLKQLAQHLQRPDDVDAAVQLACSADMEALGRRLAPRRFVSRYEKEIPVLVDRPLAACSSWYELFPRSTAPVAGTHGTFADCAALLPDIAAMGFTVVYLPPVHPIGEKNRKGRNNAVKSQPGDPGSPWAVGSRRGGHTAIEPALGTMTDFRALIKKARQVRVDIALDIAFQCAPDHPYVKNHPDWFRTLPDGTIQYAENPPKKYEDIVPFDFETDDWPLLWRELRDIVLFWAREGVRVFRVDNPHTKPFALWEWLIRQVKLHYPDTLFLAEAFTRPKIMYRLAKLGFSQSYTYFTWRNSKQEFIDYLTELTSAPVRDFFRPNFWPNTPDILPGHLQWGGRPAFVMRLVLAATLSSNYGIYGPAFELCVGRAVAEGKEEYLDSEKYEIKQWDRAQPGNLRDMITRINDIRRENPALQETANITFFPTDNDQLLCYAKISRDRTNIILVVVNLDPYHTQSGWVNLSLGPLGIAPDRPYFLQDLLGGDKYIWQGERNYVSLNPHALPAHVLRVHTHIRRENDFDYFV